MGRNLAFFDKLEMFYKRKALITFDSLCAIGSTILEFILLFLCPCSAMAVESFTAVAPDVQVGKFFLSKGKVCFFKKKWFKIQLGNPERPESKCFTLKLVGLYFPVKSFPVKSLFSSKIQIVWMDTCS